MAGICGTIQLESDAVAEDRVDAMLDRLSHRGSRSGRVRWGEIRFAAAHPSAPPIWPAPGCESPSVPCVVLDGRIDNAADLAADLARDGVQGSTNHAQLLSAGFRREGAGFLSRLQGSFAAAVHDPKTKTTWIARDPVGTRPLYLHRSRGRLIFASEIGALLAGGALRREIDPDQLRVLLALGFNPAPRTLLRGIHKMPPGHLVRIDASGVKNVRYDEPEAGDPEDLSFEDAVEEYRGLVKRVVRRCSAGPTGILLSGGPDSAALLLLHRKGGGEATTYTAGFPDLRGGDDERVSAWQAANALGTLHRERTIPVEEIGSLFLAAARIVEEPVAAAWMPPFLRLLEVPSGQVDTIWTGQGAGALHGEGEAWRWLQVGEWVAGLPERVGGLLGGVAARLGGMRHGYEKSRLIAVRDEQERILSSFFLFDDLELDRLLRPGNLGDRQTVRRGLERWREAVPDWEPLAQGLYIHRKTFLADAVLLPAMRLAAGCGLDLRFPYADPEIVRRLERLPAAYRLDGGHGKRLHREALSAWLPADVLSRPKRDLGAAVHAWIRGPGRARVQDWLLGPLAWTPSVLDPVRVRLLIESTRGRASLERIVLLVNLELWARETFLGGAR